MLRHHHNVVDHYEISIFQITMDLLFFLQLVLSSIVDYWKSEVIAFVVEFLLVFYRCRFLGEVKVRSRLLSISSNLYFKLIWIDEM
jgi:hypothetical protein